MGKEKSPCKGCGKCCYNVPLPKYMIISLRKRMVTPVERWIDSEMEDQKGNKLLLPDTKEGKCPFLTERNTCNIYEKRPWICRNFGISKHKLLQCSILYGRENKKVGSIADFLNETLELLPYRKELGL